MLRVHCVRHVPFRESGTIEHWVGARNHELTATSLVEGGTLPALREVDLLLVMGGSMSAYDDDLHPWLATERSFIAEAIEQGLPVVGICLGGQLIAQVLGGTVTRHTHREIGWWPTRSVNRGEASATWRSAWPERFLPFHWHGDTFSIPPGATLVASTDGCEHQAFEFDGGRVVGIQYHPELSVAGIQDLLARCGDDIDGSRFVQRPGQFLDRHAAANDSREVLARFLDALVEAHVPAPSSGERT